MVARMLCNPNPNTTNIMALARAMKWVTVGVDQLGT